MKLLKIAFISLTILSCSVNGINKHKKPKDYYINNKVGPLFEIYRKSRHNNIPVGRYIALDTANNDTLVKINFKNLNFDGIVEYSIPEQEYVYKKKYVNGTIVDTLFRTVISTNKTDTLRLNYDLPVVAISGEQNNTEKRSAKEIMRIVSIESPIMRFIYNSYLDKRPKFNGVIKIRYSIEPSGSVSGSEIVSSTTGYSEFDEVIRKHICTFVYRSGDYGRVIVTVPFTFTE